MDAEKTTVSGVKIYDTRFLRDEPLEQQDGLREVWL